MERINKIYNHPIYQEQYLALQEVEKDRIFCCHTLQHFLDVARIMSIGYLEDQLKELLETTDASSVKKKGFTLQQAFGLNQNKLSKEIIFATALLHDIGRYAQIVDGEPHELAGVRLAGEILPDCGFAPDEIGMIQYAIAQHRREHSKTPNEEMNYLNCSCNADLLSDLLYRADKLSRSCFNCEAQEECNWPTEKRNLQIIQ